MKQKQYRHIFFDLDHTLWDFERNSALAIELLYREHELSERLGVALDEFLPRYYAINDQKWQQYRAGQIDKEELRATRFLEAFAAFGYRDVAFAQFFERAYIETSPRQTALIEGSLDLLEFLRADGRFQLHIITNGFREVQHMKMKSSGIAHYFDIVQTSEDAGCTKPQAAIYIDALKKAGAQRKESLMIGDSLEADVLGAKQCGIDAVFFNPKAQSHAHKLNFEVQHLHQIKDIF